MKTLGWIGVLIVITGAILFQMKEHEQPAQVASSPTDELTASSSKVTKGEETNVISLKGIDNHSPYTDDDFSSDKDLMREGEVLAPQDIGCVPVKERLSTKELSVVQYWELEHGLSVEYLADVYGLHSESDLLDAAESGDADAMLALGLNYLFNARHESFRARLLFNPNERPSSFKAKALDKGILKKAYDWLWQAAINGKLIAFHYLGESMEDEQKWQKQQDDVLLAAKTTAHKLMIKSLLPHSMMRNETRVRYSEMLHEPQVQQQLAALKASWAAEREQQGLDPISQIPVPEEVQQHMHTLLLECEAFPQ